MNIPQCESFTSINGVRMICDKPKGHNESCRMILPRNDGHVPGLQYVTRSGDVKPWPTDPREAMLLVGWPRQSKPAVNHATESLVKPERRVDIISFRNALERICEAYGVKLKGDTDASGDILIYDQRRTLPHGYDWSAYIEPNGQLEFAEFVLEDEAGATKQ